MSAETTVNWMTQSYRGSNSWMNYGKLFVTDESYLQLEVRPTSGIAQNVRKHPSKGPERAGLALSLAASDVMRLMTARYSVSLSGL
jgi:hypothetical protein